MLNSIKSNIFIPSKHMTKEWRKLQSWYKGGKKNECEIKQREWSESIVGTIINKTKIRLNKRSLEMKIKKTPNKFEDGFDWTEDFDGLISNIDKKFYFNFKMCICSGGAQTRTLREVFTHIETQLNYLNKLKETSTKLDTINEYFINILDGDICYHHRDKFEYLLNLSVFEEVKKYVFVGDTFEFNDWYTKKSYLLVDSI